MAIQASQIKDQIENELTHVSHETVVDHIRQLLVIPHIVMRQWDYGEPETVYPCWSALEHPNSNTCICYSEHGFGPTYPWGLVNLKGNQNEMSMGMDSAWFPCFVETYLDSFVSAELPIWRVIQDGAPISDESDWDSTWKEVYLLRETNKSSRYDCGHSVEYQRSEI